MKFKKISVITPTFNRREMLETAIKNVMAQDYPNLEHVVVDGGSKDGTQDMVVRQYPHVRFICEPDKGMYDALNKGIKVSSGEIIGFLNTDDLYTDNIFGDIVVNFEDEKIMAVAGCAVVFTRDTDEKMEIVGRYSPRDRTLLECSTIGSNYFNAWLFRRSVFEKIGGFNIDYRIAGDRDFMLRFTLSSFPYVESDRVVYQYLQHPESLTFHYNAEKRDRVTREHLAMTDFYLKGRGISALERKMIFQLRTNETVDIATRAIKEKNLRKFFSCAYEGLKRDPFWLYKFAKAPLAFRIKKAIRFVENIFGKPRQAV